MDEKGFLADEIGEGGWIKLGGLNGWFAAGGVYGGDSRVGEGAGERGGVRRVRRRLFQFVLDLFQFEERLDRGQPVDIGIFQQLPDAVKSLGMCIENRQLHLRRRYFLQ